MVHHHYQSAVEYFGVAVNAGSRDELPGEEGLAHFVEHTIFKGTDHRRAWHILNRMEAVGGELNAYTTKEETMIYSLFPAGNLPRACELIADLVTSSVFPRQELDREREVVTEEIDSYLDTPAESVFDDFEDLLFKGSSLGHNILGNALTVSRFTTADCRRWIERNYTASRMVVFYSGPMPAARVERLCSRHFASIPAANGLPHRPTPPAIEPFKIVHDCKNHQAHTVMGARIPGMYSPSTRAMALLSNILGGPGMNSLLNVELRERRGLVYSVETSCSLFTDVGVMEIYFGSNSEDTRRCSDLACRIIGRLIDTPLSDSRLRAAKRQFEGQLLIASQNRENLVMSIARAALFNLPIVDNATIAAEIAAIKADDLRECARHLQPATISSLTLA